MYKLVLGALVSLLLIVTPASAARVQSGTVAGAPDKPLVKKSRAVRKAAVRRKVAAPRPKPRRVLTLGPKSKEVYQRVAGAARRAVMSAGDLAGLNLTRDPLDLKSSVAFVLDQSNSQVLFEKNAGIALPIASITKLMTGLIVVQAQQDMNQILTITDDDVDHEKHTGSRLRVGAHMTRANMLHIALMSSENRAASALGRNYPGGLPAFVAAMNAKARELGMNDTRYVDASGLSSRNVASARDLAKLVVVAHQEPLLREYSTDPKSVVEAGGRMLHFSNTNYLVASPDWDIGLQKTGFINEAGRCLVMQAVIQGRAVVMVFLDSKGKQSRTADAGRMRKWLEALKPEGM
ncbi:MAG: D-alanyl-D-alanine endopeptidase [Telluria sp.]|nr:D-alanyl-D-alanine endopeptidase [Telluria sp.]